MLDTRSQSMMNTVKNTTCIGAMLGLLLAFCVSAHAAPADDGVRAAKAGRYAEAWRLLVPLAQKGDPEAQRTIGEMYYRGQGAKADPEAAFKWNEAAAQSGDMVAEFNLGYLYERGEGVAASRAKALDFYTRSARHGYVLAQTRLGDWYASIDRSQALRWYRNAMQLGDEEARAKFKQLDAEEQRVAEAERKQADREQEERERQEKARQDAWLRERAERDAREAEEDASERSTRRQSTPFDGLDSINKVMRDGQRSIAAAQAERARQQAYQREAETSRRAETRERKPTPPQQVAQADFPSNTSPGKLQTVPSRTDKPLEPERVARADVVKPLAAGPASSASGKQTQQPAADAGSKAPKKSHSMNTGKSAMQCVSVSQKGDDVEFRNTCDKQIFVVWCGDLKYTKQKCGDGPKGNSYYTHSNNIQAGAAISTSVSGQYHYAACEGGIAFGKDEIQDRPDGSFTCIPE